ncbi:conjugal transfer protein [Aquibium carbonis]|jgi:type IV secretion system protein TrbD|uniref:Conjugal transfer protein n=1 Tax=Aquibium carbonis TaxID=2495581 RepID=A0A429YYR3_9HYPH|nr:VirB3 family type IV secretion system protein [Aquibium carbonis]RST86615.1 conjugal transfer protein [Aquibium carbonis]
MQDEDVRGFFAPVHRALTEPILLGGAPRAVAILNGTLAGAVGLGLRLWLAGLAIWAIGHFAAVWAAKRDPLFVDVVRRHLRYPTHLGV